MSFFDAIVVGSGAGGGVAAYVLATRGYQVALLEKGRNPIPGIGESTLRGSQFGADELKARRAFAFQDPFSEPRTLRASAAQTGVVKPLQELGVAINSVAYRGRPACQNGGFCNTGAAGATRMRAGFSLHLREVPRLVTTHQASVAGRRAGWHHPAPFSPKEQR